MTELPAVLTATGERHCNADDVTAYFDSLPACDIQMLKGRFAGQEILTGHSLDGSLAAVSWFGKQFDAPDRVHPLLVADSRGRVFPLRPGVIPMAAMTGSIPIPRVSASAAPGAWSFLGPLVRARRYGARLEERDHRGIRTAAMPYTHKPIVDVFRAIDDETVLGMMEYPQMTRPYFFTLRRERQEY
ncbi:GXWXG domain-containing protein [Gordonia insulae]|uniref:DUF4334 domain-containing protein n=1 Tax=Gordonia insulae TaxID=2420509 RepID=A0A3G8JQ52_9ACTN|nr:GXWXG domain-containing protein [Gordonia insulae]AZG47217.1 hypothetical protein D7316_03825 [Gordonia insulae]